MEKVKLLNNGGYAGLEEVEFPVEVMAARDSKQSSVVFVSAADIVNVGGNTRFMTSDESDFPFIIGKECEIIK